MNYLLDTNICIHYVNGRYELRKKFLEVGYQNIVISEITVAEMMYGAEYSDRPHENKIAVAKLLTEFNVIYLYASLPEYAKQKARLRKIGKLIGELDMFIGAIAISNNLMLVTANTDEFSRLEGIQLEDWTKT